MNETSNKDALRLFAAQFTPPAQTGGGVAIPSLTGAADAFLAAALAQPNHLVLAITPGIPEADRLADDLHTLLNGDRPHSSRILEFPPMLADDKAALGVRLKTISALKAWGLSPYPCIVIAPIAALQDPIPSGPVPSLHLGTDPHALGTDPNQDSCYQQDFGGIVAKLAEIGYRRVPQVEQDGDFSVRGGIIDVWSPGDEFPFRAEFFGDDLESLRTFDPATQRSTGSISRVEILPITLGTDPAELGTGPAESMGTGPKNSGESMGTDPKSDSDLATDFTNYRGLFDLLPEDAIILALEHNDSHISTFPPFHLSHRQRGGASLTIYTGDPAPAGVATWDFTTTPLPGFAELGADEAHHPELFDAARKRLEQHLAAAEMRGKTVVRIDDLSGGFEVGNLVVVTKADRVFAKRKVHLRANATPAGARLDGFDDLEPGEYVVHVDYGVGRYVGTSEILLDGKRCEVFTIEYADGAKLHVPAAHAHLLSRYVGVKGREVHLHRIDGRRWAKDRKAAQKAVGDLAAALLETQARRETAPGFSYDVNCDGREAFDAAFPYEETPDQKAAIAAVDADLAASKPMDRLVCGDAGYGKTEVAMRAAFVVAMNGRQVAVLAPTTVLAEQHYETFLARFDGTPIRVECVSRFLSPAERDGVFRRMAAGVCDIVIGTHALLSDKTCFANLGLVVIDEEQRFGVRHKEFLKRLRSAADVLTLSATPIPRTLYMAMTGARDLSLLRTPPRERVAVETRVVRDSDEAVRAAVDAELARGGQVYFLHNRVMTIGRAAQRLRALCPRARVVVAHGQMDARTLAGKMRDFAAGRYDVLLSTTIVESGIDIPRANTIVVERADTFGVADLYQLRGRVGRSARQGRALFLLPPSGDVDAEARERLDALRRHGGLGGGFGLAVRDLELRGAGNLLGSQQSGHVAAIGFGLYCQLLRRTISQLKGEKAKPVVDTRVSLDFATPSLPCDYVEEDSLRLSLMRRFAEAQDVRTVAALADEMRDRFGPPPDEADAFVRVAALRIRCAEAGIGVVDVVGDRAVFRRADGDAIAFVHDVRGRTAAGRIANLTRAVQSWSRSEKRS